ncbi:GNAT family N-acetyltransferase [bacterium]|nr:GNAT family N-acetyltransferase [bacterium]
MLKCKTKKQRKEFEFYPLTSARWEDFQRLFGERGACGGCWCMTWRLKKSEFDMHKGAGNKKLMKKIVWGGKEPGIIAYNQGIPVGWCAVAPRTEFIRLEGSRVLAPIDDLPVWSITCFFITKEFRRKGLSTELLKAVIAYGKKKKVKILEAYPAEPYTDNIPAAFAWTGIPSAFLKAGFTEAARRSKARPIMRYYL